MVATCRRTGGREEGHQRREVVGLAAAAPLENFKAAQRLCWDESIAPLIDLLARAHSGH